MLKLIILILCLFIILYHFNRMEKDVEGFIEGFRQLKVENFESEIPSVNDMEGENETPKMEQASEESYAVPLNGNNNKKKRRE